MVSYKNGYGTGMLTPFGAKLIGSIVLLFWIINALSKKGLLKERELLDSKKYPYLDLRKKKTSKRAR